MKRKKIKIKWDNVISAGGILVCFIIILVITINIFRLYLDKKHTKEQISNILDIVNIEYVKDIENIVYNDDNNNLDFIDVELSSLKDINNETVGWIDISGTSISVPFVQHSDNLYYLTKSFNNKKNIFGWIFLDYRNSFLTDEYNKIIYMYSDVLDSTFDSIKNVFNNSWYKDDDKMIRISSEYENSIWEIFSVYRVPITDDYLKIYFDSDLDYENYLNKIVDRSAYSFNTIVNKNNKIITFSTHYNSKEDLVIHAKLIKKMTK